MYFKDLLSLRLLLRSIEIGIGMRPITYFYLAPNQIINRRPGLITRFTSYFLILLSSDIRFTREKMASNLRDREGQALGKMITLSSKGRLLSSHISEILCFLLDPMYLLFMLELLFLL